MARTINGKLTGRAAQTEARDIREAIEADRAKLIAEWNETLYYLQDNMTESDFAEWWDSYPADMSKREFLPVMQKKVAELNEQSTLAHIDALVGDERLTVAQMVDAVELPFDFTPCGDMPVINFDKIEEIKF